MTAGDETRGAVRTARLIAEECIGVRIRLLNRALTRIYDDALRPHGIRFSQMNILTVIAMQTEPVPPSEVSRSLSIEKSTLSRNLRIMEDNGWILSPADRGGGLRVTPAGRRLLKRVEPAWREAQDRVTAKLGDRSTRTIVQAAARVRLADGDE